MKILTAILVLSLAAPASAQAHSGPEHEVAAIEKVVESFRTALINKDKATYMGLFFSDKPEEIGWQFVSEDTRLAHIRESKPDAIKARRIPANNFIGLIDGAVATKEPREETIENLRIETDGEIASASFDYSYLANGKKANWGREMWQLLRTEQGWKIYSVVYTIRDEWTRAEATPLTPAAVSAEAFLLAAAAGDFRAHPPLPVAFREVHLGHMEGTEREPHYLLCGQYRTAPAGEWLHFATVKTSGYEQWLGGQSVSACDQSSFHLDREEDLAPQLQSRFDALAR